MSSTNKTSHYNLSQYIGTDKPTYLVDYNADMSAIDTGIYNAKNEADTNATSIGTLSNLTTDAKSNLVGAINEVDSHADTNAGNISTNTTNIATNTGHIGVMANLDTTEKTNLVGAVNEVNTLAKNIEKLNFAYFDTFDASSFSLSGATLDFAQVTVASNSDGSVGKVYGHIVGKCTSNNNGSISVQTRLRPTANITINTAGITFFEYPTLASEKTNQRTAEISISTTGVLTIVIPEYAYDYTTEQKRIFLMPCVYFMQDFGDTPIPE